MGTIRTTWRRRAATTVVAGASALALGATSVSAAPAAGPTNFAGQAEALALDLDLKLPAGLGASADSINQLISQTLTELDSAGKVAAKADLLSGLLEQPALQFTGDKKSDTKSLANLKDPLGIVSVEAGTLSYTADASNRVTNAASELLNLEVGLAETADVETALEDAKSALEELIGTPTSTESDSESDSDVNGTLNALLDDIEDRLKADPQLKDVDIPVIAPTDLIQIPDASDLTSLATVRKLWSETSTQTEAATNAIASTAEGGVVGMSLLGGLVKVPDFEFSSLAKTNGKPGGAVAEAVTKKLEVELAGNPVIGVSGDDLVIEGLPAIDLTEEELGELNALLDDILNAVGLDIAQGKTTEQVAPDGSHAKASTSALAISLSPLNVLRGTQDPAGGLNVALKLLPTLAEVRASNAVAPGAKPPAAVDRPTEGKKLPTTGGGALAVLAGGVALGGAFALRRFTKS